MTITELEQKAKEARQEWVKACRNNAMAAEKLEKFNAYQAAEAELKAARGQQT